MVVSKKDLNILVSIGINLLPQDTTVNFYMVLLWGIFLFVFWQLATKWNMKIYFQIISNYKYTYKVQAYKSKEENSKELNFQQNEHLCIMYGTFHNPPPRIVPMVMINIIHLLEISSYNNGTKM